MVTTAYSDNSTLIWCNGTILSQLKWYHNGKRISQDNRVVIFPNGTLSVSHLSWRDAGVYQCIVQNDAGQAIALTQLNVLSNFSFIFLHFDVFFIGSL